VRIESSVTSLSWIPSEAVQGMTRLPFEMGVAHYDPPPPDFLDDLDALRQATASGSPTSCGHGSTRLPGQTPVRPVQARAGLVQDRLRP